tara:strand:- start:16505 stop:17119 length:615 start_codon:yes stop_codon:yes gene_type:complete
MANWSEHMYPVMEQFLTVQGEGAHTGKSAWFIRLGGCDVGCAFCDVKESWDVEAHPKVSCAVLVENAKQSGAPICVVTGGEPAMHELGPLTEGLHEIGVKTHIETSGAHKMSGDWDWVTLSPKRFKAAREDSYAHADELKIVVVNRHDISWGEEHTEKLLEGTELFFQPEWDRREKVLPYIMNHIKINPRWRISLQTHKYIGLP